MLFFIQRFNTILIYLEVIYVIATLKKKKANVFAKVIILWYGCKGRSYCCWIAKHYPMKQQDAGQYVNIYSFLKIFERYICWH